MSYRYSRGSAQNAFRSDYALSTDQIRHYAPSVLAEEAHESRGERYTFIPTIQVIDGLRAQGFQPYEVRQTRVRDQSKREHTKHLVRLRHESAIATKEQVGEIILLNSHDGTSAYQLLSGFFRFVCSNGLIAGDVCNDVRVRHSGNVVDNVIEGSFEVLDNLQQIESRIDQYKAITLSTSEQILLAEEAITLRWDENKSPIVPAQLLRVKRSADADANLWTTFNRIQESLTQGGLKGRTVGTGRSTRTRAVGGVTENVKLNKALWSLTEKFAQLKTAA
jgi:hypothetical protein